jgi:hypothetical protein
MLKNTGCSYIFFVITKPNINQISEDKVIRFAAFCTVRYKVFAHRARSTVIDVMALRSVITNNGDRAGKGSMYCADFGVKLSVKGAEK